MAEPVVPFHNNEIMEDIPRGWVAVAWIMSVLAALLYFLFDMVREAITFRQP